MDPLRLQIVLLRSALPDLVLRPGMTLAARVLERHEQRGLIMLAGVPLTAELPDAVAAGDRLRLRVEEASGERVVLKLIEQPQTAAIAPALALPLPDGRNASVRVDERAAEGGPEEERSVALTYESPALGAIELRLSVAPGAASALVGVALGQALELASDRADALREALAAATGRAAEVRVVPRREPIDVYS